MTNSDFSVLISWDVYSRQGSFWKKQWLFSRRGEVSTSAEACGLIVSSEYDLPYVYQYVTIDNNDKFEALIKQIVDSHFYSYHIVGVTKRDSKEFINNVVVNIFMGNKALSLIHSGGHMLALPFRLIPKSILPDSVNIESRQETLRMQRLHMRISDTTITDVITDTNSHLPLGVSKEFIGYCGSPFSDCCSSPCKVRKDMNSAHEDSEIKLPFVYIVKKIEQVYKNDDEWLDSYLFNVIDNEEYLSAILKELELIMSKETYSEISISIFSKDLSKCYSVKVDSQQTEVHQYDVTRKELQTRAFGDFVDFQKGFEYSHYSKFSRSRFSDLEGFADY